MSEWIPWTLMALSLLGLAINLYFISLSTRLPAWMKTLLHQSAQMCGVDGGACRVVYETRYARLLGGIPNVAVGMIWNLWVIGCSIVLLVTGLYPLWEVSVAVASASIAAGMFLTWVLMFVLRKPCPL